MKAVFILSLVSMISMIAAQGNSLRFINAIEGTTLTIYSNKLSELQVPYLSTTSYYPIADGTIQITNVVDQNGNSYTNGIPIATSFGPYHTLAAVYNADEADPTKRFTLVLFNETMPSDTSDSSRAFVRLMDLSRSVQYVTLASQAGTVASFVGYLQTTAYAPVAATTTSMRIWDSQSGSYNSPALTFDTAFTGLTAYTVVFFTTSAGVKSAKVVMDRTVTQSTTGSTTGSSATLSLSTPSIRFVNAIEGATLSIFTNKLNDISLPFMEATSYFPIADGTISISNVVNNGVSYNNGNPISTSFGPYNTLVAVMNDAESDPAKKFLFVLFNETTPSNMDTENSDSTKAWVRLMDFAQTGRFVTLAYTAGAIASNIGFLVNTPFVAIPATTTSMRFYDSQSGSYNSPSLTLNTAFNPKNAYTIMFFQTKGGVQSAKIWNDRQVGGQGVASTTGAQTATTGAEATTTGTQQTTTTEGAVTTGVTIPPMTTGGVINNQENGAGKLAAFGLASIIAIALL